MKGDREGKERVEERRKGRKREEGRGVMSRRAISCSGQRAEREVGVRAHPCVASLLALDQLDDCVALQLPTSAHVYLRRACRGADVGGGEVGGEMGRGGGERGEGIAGDERERDPRGDVG